MASYTSEVFFMSFFSVPSGASLRQTDTTRTVTPSRREIIRASASYKFLTAFSSILPHPCNGMRATGEKDRRGGRLS